MQNPSGPSPSEPPPKKKGKKTQRDSLWRLAHIMGNGGFAAIYVFVYTKAIDKADYGVYGTLIAAATILQTFAGAGLRQATHRFIAHARGQGALGRLRQFATHGLGLSGVSTLGTLLIALAVYALWRERFEDVGWPLAFLVMLYVAGRVPLYLLQGVLEGLARFRAVSISLLALNVVQLVLVLGGALLGLNVFRIMLLEVAISWLSVIVLGLQVRWELREIPPQGYSAAITREVLIFGLPLIINKAGGFLFTRVDIFFVRSYLEATDVADYFLLLNLFDFPLRALSAYIFVLATDVAHEHGAGARGSLLTRFYRAESFGFLVGLGLSAAFFLGSFLVPLILPEYAGTAHLMRLLSPLLVLKAVAQVASGGFMISLGRSRAMAALTFVGGALNVLLDVLLIPRYGTAGAVYATLIGHSAIGVFGVLYVYWGVRRVARGE